MDVLDWSIIEESRCVKEKKEVSRHVAVGQDKSLGHVTTFIPLRGAAIATFDFFMMFESKPIN